MSTIKIGKVKFTRTLKTVEGNPGEDYKFIERLGEGYFVMTWKMMNRSFGVVWKAVHRETGEEVAIKQVRVFKGVEC